MVRRSTDEPRTALDRAVANGRKTDEVTRALGRGTTAMRDSAGNVLQMNPEAPYPLLRPQGVDAAVAFDPNTNEIKMVSPDTSEDRDMTVRDITSSGSVHANDVTTVGNTDVAGIVVRGNGIACYAGMHATGDIVTDGALYVTTDTYAGWLHATNGDFTGNVNAPRLIASIGVYGPNYTTTTSDARLKEQFRPVDEDMLDRLLATPVQRWRWKARWTWDERTRQWFDERPDDREHVHPVAQDMPSELVVEQPDGHLGVDPMTASGALLALVQRQQRQIDELRRDVASLREAT